MKRIRFGGMAFLLIGFMACAQEASTTAQTETQSGEEEDGKGDGWSSYCWGAPIVEGTKLLVAIENGGAVMLDPQSGETLSTYATGPNAFGAVFSSDGERAFVTDKNDGTLLEIDPQSSAVVASLPVGASPQQPAVTSDGRMYIPLSGEAAIAVIDTGGALSVLRRISTGEGTKPHIVSLSPDERKVWSTVQGRDPKVVAIDVTSSGEGATQEFRYDLVPRVIAATYGGAFYTGHHSTGLHRASVADGTNSTPYMDVFGDFSEARKQIEGVATNADGSLVAVTHEGRRALLILSKNTDGQIKRRTTISGLSANPYWTTLDPSGQVAYVSIPDSGTVKAYDTRRCLQKHL